MIMCRLVMLLFISYFPFRGLTPLKCRFEYDISYYKRNIDTFFECDTGKCIPTIDVCNGIPDCEDGSDESYDTCYNYKNNFDDYNSFNKCSKHEYQCKKKFPNYVNVINCIPITKLCDGTKDCWDGSDEYDDCVKDLNCDNKFRCDDGHCIIQEWVCDSSKDCPDGSDEKNCANKTLSASNCKIENSQYLCENQLCIPLDLVCNGKTDCDDLSDEGPGCTPSSCPSSVKCDHECKQTPKGSKCLCKPGYKLQNDSRTCTDIDECQTYGICDQECVNSPGSYSCKCQTDYFLHKDKKTCKANDNTLKMFISTKTEITKAYFLEGKYFELSENVKHSNYYMVSVAVNDKHIYFSDTKENITVIVKNTLENPYEVIVTAGLSEISAIAIDWITRNIYFTDRGYHRIGVCNNDGTYCTVLINNIDEPTGIALLPTRGEIYWSEWGSNPYIAVAGMDGKNIRTFVSENLQAPKSLTIDYPTDRLYWADSKLKIIESIRLDGTDRRVILHDIILQPFSLTIFENKLYWSEESESDLLLFCNKFTGKNVTGLFLNKHCPCNIHIEAVKPKINNPCDSNPCSELCMLNQDKGYMCACTLDKELNADNHTCREVTKKQHLLIFDGKNFINYYDGMLGKPKVRDVSKSPCSFVKKIVSDPISGQVIILCDELEQIVIKRFDPVSNIFENMILINKADWIGLEDMAFDYIGNNLYLTNSHDKSIEVRNVKTSARTIFYFKNYTPAYITLVPEESKMYVGGTVFQKPHTSLTSVYEMEMNGLGDRKLLMELEDLMKISMSYHRESKTLFVYDMYEMSGNIWSHSAKGTHMIPASKSGIGLRNKLNNRRAALTIFDDNIFWIEYYSNVLHWTDLKSPLNYSALYIPTKSKDSFDSIRLSVVTLRKDAKQDHYCQKNNGNCSHVCLPSFNTSFICACPPGMALSSNNRTCVMHECPKNEFKCSEHNVCIRKENLCDGIIHCQNGEDETIDCYEKKKCKKDEFTCTNGECIDIKKRCNWHYDCTDHSDEVNCVKPECESDEFQCLNGVTHCILKLFLCDGDFDCEDGSDETQEVCIKDVLDAECLDGTFQCTNGYCISLSLKCNGIADCPDGSDERHCLTKPNYLVNCTKNEYQCLDTNLCLPKQKKCNGIIDCPRKDDEHHCAFCFNDEFACDNAKCIQKNYVCDKIDDCDDNSDEKNCDGDKKIVTESIECDEFKCSIGTCLPYSKVCDGIQDCLDGSDENEKCQTACAVDHCEGGVCHKTSKGDVCDCLDGYRLAANATSCEDINECESDVCSQFCQNTPGSFECSCHDGYVMRDDKVSCKAIGQAMEFITVTDDDIRIISSNLHSVDMIQSLSGSSINGFDVNAIHNSVYWSNSEFGTIKKLNILTKKMWTITVEHPQALSIDWITDNVYVNDNGLSNTIQVCNFEKQRCATLVKIENNTKVESLVVDSTIRWLFWSQITWQINKPSSKICRTDMMGANMKIIVSDVGFVSGMAIDRIKSKLYWLDSFNQAIKSSNLDGSQHSIFLSFNMHHTLGINIYEQSLYWLTGVDGQLRRCKLYDKKFCEILRIGTNNVHRHFAILHISRQPFVKNPCDEENCDYMCVMKKESATCICPNGKPIKSNVTCTINSESLIGNTQHITIYIVIIVVLLVVILLLCVYNYYQRRRSQWKLATDLNSHRICFQNPSYDRRDEVELILDSTVEDLSPEQHEYVNPINS